MSSYSHILIAISVSTIAVGQILLKVASRNLNTEVSGYVSFIRENGLSLSIIGVVFLLYLASTAAWVLALRAVPLSVAYVFNALAFIFVPAAAFLIFGESVPRFFIPGTALIVGGIMLISYG